MTDSPRPGTPEHSGGKTTVVEFTDQQIAEIASRVTPEDHLRTEPPANVWTGIVVALRDELIQAEDEDRRSSAAARARQRWWPVERTQQLLVGAAASIALIAGGLVALNVLSSDEPEIITVASAELSNEGLPEPTEAVATAVVSCQDTDCWVDIDFTTVPTSSADALELWVIDADVADMHSLGEVLESGRYDLPEGVGPDAFPIVDLSWEPRDGDETHSGRSLLRGVFDPTVS